MPILHAADRAHIQHVAFPYITGDPADNSALVEYIAANGGGGLVTGDAETAELDTQYFEAGDVNFAGDGTRIIVDNTNGTISLEGINGVFVNGVELVP